MEAILKAWQDHWIYSVPFAIVWFSSWIIASIIYRGLNGKAVFASVPEGCVFLEKWTSGRSLRNLLTRIGGAHNCLLVAVTPEMITVCPHFPFTLLFLPEIYRLDVRIPHNSIRQVTKKSGIFKDSVLIEFDNNSEQVERISLSLRSNEKFLKAIST